MFIIAVCMFVCVHMVGLTGPLVKRVCTRIRAAGKKEGSFRFQRVKKIEKFELLL